MEHEQRMEASQAASQADARVEVEKRRRIESETAMESYEAELRGALERLALAERRCVPSHL
jgi:hypothetical protein